MRAKPTNDCLLTTIFRPNEFVILILVNHYSDDVMVRINFSGKLEVEFVGAKQGLTVRKKFKMKTMLSITAVDAATKRPLYINGQSVIHLQSTTWEVSLVKVLHIEGRCNLYTF